MRRPTRDGKRAGPSLRPRYRPPGPPPAPLPLTDPVAQKAYGMCNNGHIDCYVCPGAPMRLRWCWS